jgi:hypothetical protein
VDDDHGPVASQQDRAPREGQAGGRIGDRRGIASPGDPVSLELHVVDEGGVTRALADVFRDVDQYRPRTAGGGDVEGSPRDARDLGCVSHEIAVLHHGVRDAGDVGFLEAVLSQHRLDALARDHDDRNRVHLGCQKAGDRVGGPGTRRHEHDTRPAGGARIAVRHVGGALLVAHEDQFDRGVDECVENRDRGPSGEAEDVLDALSFEALDQLLCAGGDSLGHGFGSVIK